MTAGVTLAALQALADAQTDLAAAQEMQRSKAELFELFKLFELFELFNGPRTRSAKQV